MGKQYLNGVLYGTGEIIKFSPYIYSLEEREVGVWTDGKPLYQKSYVFTNHALSNGNNNIFLDVLQNGYCDTIVQSFAYITNSAKTSIRPINNYNNTTDALDYGLFYGIGEGFITITTHTSWSSPNIYITLQYTKTTDTPGSGHYTTKGGEAHHYSTSEQIVGTWIDGKPLYEKTIVATMTSSAKKLELSSECVIHSVQGGVSDNSNNKFVAFGFVTTSNDYVRTYQEFEGGTNGLYVQNSYYSTRPKVTAIIQYTKTTD